MMPVTVDYPYEIRRLLEHYRVDRGFTHPAEAVIQEWVTVDQSAASAWLTEQVTSNSKWSVDLFHSLTFALEDTLPSLGYDLAERALQSDKIALRDEAVLLLNLYGGEQGKEILLAHDEPCRWLRESIQQVLKDWGWQNE